MFIKKEFIKLRKLLFKSHSIEILILHKSGKLKKDQSYTNAEKIFTSRCEWLSKCEVIEKHIGSRW